MVSNNRNINIKRLENVVITARHALTIVTNKVDDEVLVTPKDPDKYQDFIDKVEMIIISKLRQKLNLL